SLIPEEARPEEHLRIGRLLLLHTPADKRDETIFEIVNQLNRGAALITSRAEREQLAGLDLIAGKRAKASTAYAAALSYLSAGGGLLGDDRWQRCHALTFALGPNRAAGEFLTGRLGAAEKHLAELSASAAGPVEEGLVACLRIDLYAALVRNDRAVEVAIDYLRGQGIVWSAHPTAEAARREYGRIWSELGSRTLEELIDLPSMTDAEALATLDVLTRAGPAAMFTDANLSALVMCRAINLSIEHGNGEASAVAYVWLGVICGHQFGDYQAAFR